MGNGILIYNVFVEENEDNKYRLNVEEMYLWSVLRRLMNYNQETITSIKFIDEYTRKYLNTYFYKKVSPSRKQIKNCLLSLVEKGVIHSDCEPEKDSEVFKITFAKLNGGHEFIPFSTFDSMNNTAFIYIHFAILKWKGTKEGTFNCSNDRWTTILGVDSENTAKKYLKQCEEEGFLYRVMGDYTSDKARFGQSKQDMYKYKTTPFTEEEKSNMQRVKERKNNPTPDIESIGNSDYLFDTGNWTVRGKVELTVDDYVIYLEHKRKTDPLSKDFVADCDNKRKFIMSKNEKFEHVDEKLKKQAEDEIDERKRQQKEEMAEQRKQAKMDKVKDGQIIVKRLKSGATDPFDDEDVYLDDFNKVKTDDTIYFVDFKGDLDTMTIEQLITGWTTDLYLDYYNYSDDVQEELLHKAKEIIYTHGYFDVDTVKEELKSVRKEIANSHNRDRSYDEEHEGDLIHEDQDTPPINLSLRKRIRTYQPPIKIQL
ncbi:hypothetical protein [Oceanobacillus massiliensis]|uniref:hypothetical protein n=1 Tax=Oceanobacillus massiliensis TaxID=1465765 RepID=UPI00028A3E45|nr:hypothetical protein [Oceanobacillus massiliensis]